MEKSDVREFDRSWRVVTLHMIYMHHVMFYVYLFGTYH